MPPITFLSLWTFLSCVSFCGIANPQDDPDLHMRIVGREYRDDKIVVRLPKGWQAAVDSDDSGSETYGLILHKGQYILRLCTACGQASGVVGGRFSEIVGLVQPWFRANMDNPGPCGKQEEIRVSKQISRVDLWFRRDPAHTYNEAADDCREPRTKATVWYGSYFEENCPPNPGVNCGGYFLYNNWLTLQNAKEANDMDEMVFALTSDKDDLNQLPHRGDPELEQVLREASAVVRSVHYQKLPKTAHERE